MLLIFEYIQQSLFGKNIGYYENFYNPLTWQKTKKNIFFPNKIYFIVCRCQLYSGTIRKI